MKYRLSLFALIICTICACKTGSETEQTQNQPPEPVSSTLWVNYDGNEGPGKGKHIVFVSGDEEYRSEEALPQLAKILSTHHGFKSTVLFAQNPEKPGIIDPNYLNNIPGLEALKTADLMVIFTRFRELPDEQMQHIEDYLKSGKPVIGIRTATHAFNIKDSTSKWTHYDNFYSAEGDPWDGGFGRLVLGEKWISHHGHHKHQSTRGIIDPEATDHPITTSLEDGDLWGPTDVYGVRMPLPGDAKPIIRGQVINRPGEFDESDAFFGMRPTDSEVASSNPAREASGNPNDPMMPVAWTKSYQLPGGQLGQAFAATIGSSTDMVSDGVRRMYVNAAYYLLGMDVPANANVSIVGEYNPSPYSFHDDQHWVDLNLKVVDHMMK